MDALRGIADAAERSRDEVTRIVLTVPELRTFASDYVAMTGEIATSARGAAAAVATMNLDAVDREAAAMDAASKRERPIVDGVNAFCGAR